MPGPGPPLSTTELCVLQSGQRRAEVTFPLEPHVTTVQSWALSRPMRRGSSELTVSCGSVSFFFKTGVRHWLHVVSLGIRVSFASLGRRRQRDQALAASVLSVVCILSHDMLLNTFFFFNLNYIVTIAEFTFTIYKKKDDFIAFKLFYSLKPCNIYIKTSFRSQQFTIFLEKFTFGPPSSFLK